MEREPLHVEMRRARERKGISLSDIFESTRIRIDLLEALEQGQHDILPIPYVRLFLRAYAEKVGLDSHYVLERYEEETKYGKVGPRTKTPQKVPTETPQKVPTEISQKVPTEISQKVPTETPQKVPTEIPQKPSIKIPWRGAIAAGVVAIVVIFLVMGRSEHERADQTIQSSVERPEQVPPVREDAEEAVSPSSLSPVLEDTTRSMEPAASPSEEDKVDASEELAATEPLAPEIAGPDSLLTLIARAQIPTWVRIYGDQRIFFQGTLDTGEERTWTARDTFFVISGKPLGTEFVFQGEPVPQNRLPKEGILRLRFTRRGVELVEPR